MTSPQSFAPQAARDVEAAAEWIADNAGGSDAARRMVQAVLAADRVASRPGLGRLRPDLLPAPFPFLGGSQLPISARP